MRQANVKIELLAQLAEIRRRVGVLIRQRGRAGETYVNPSVVLDIEDAQKEIRGLKKELRRLGVKVENHPNDGDFEAIEPPGLHVAPDPLPPEPVEHPLLGLQLSEWGMLLEWVVATIGGWLTIGLLSGWLQQRVLRRRLGDQASFLFPLWLFTTTPAMVVTVLVTAKGASAGAIGGVVVAFVQWLDLRRISATIGLWRWLLVSAIGGGLANTLIFVPAQDQPRYYDLATASLILPVTVSAAVYGCITGFALVWMLHTQQKA